MRIRPHLPGSFAVGLGLAFVIGCASMPAIKTGELIRNPSFHILVNNEHAVPNSGTFDFDTKLFKIDYEEAVDLAAVDKRIVTALEAELKRKGLTRRTENPDLLISYALAMDAPLTGADFNAAYAEDFPISLPEPEPGQDLSYHQGALIVDVVDADSRNLLWRGGIMAGVTMDVGEREKSRRVRHAVRILFEHFPKPIRARL